MKSLTVFFTLFLFFCSTYAHAAETYTVGPNPSLGGYVFYVTPNGKHGLVVTTQDQGISNWYGAPDTARNPENHDAAGQNFTDWRLPVAFELELIYKAQSEIGGFGYEFYWSMTAWDAENGDGINMKTGERASYDKSSSDHGSNAIRAVRSF